MALALLHLTSHLVVGDRDTCETPTCIPCWGRNAICIPVCVALHFTGGFCKGATCVCTKQFLAEVETEASGRSQPPVEPPLGKRGMGMLN
ncbi:unnamed protein product [Miscanthus lutarioriparius]|uniref:Secreted protein n=1 Tax=Miscanthus lutarioriparius TaxID=422564 RepID=A0A811QEE5_9POAL|nr:unnamed protein product [Miscanthus lutarioriparius]